jgi:hypothetical protein
MKKYKEHITFEIEEIKKIIKESTKQTKIYLGCDSQIMRRKQKIRYATVIILHIDGNHGCKIFGKVSFEKLTPENKSKPFNRMMKEVQKITDMYFLFEEELLDKDFEIHIDVNPDETYGSNIAYGAAKGYVQSLIGIEPTFKPFAFAASCAADKFCRK